MASRRRQTQRGGQPLVVTLLSSDHQLFQISEPVARRSGVICTVLEDIGARDPIPLLNVPSSVLKKVLEYCEHHQNDPTPPPDGEWNSSSSSSSGGSQTDLSSRRKITISDWDAQYIGACEQELLFEVIQAASYLDIKALLDLGCKTVANMMNGKSVEEIRELFNIENDFTPEEELAMQVERSEIEMFYDMMGRQIEGSAQQPSNLAGKAPRRRIAHPHPHY